MVYGLGEVLILSVAGRLDAVGDMVVRAVQLALAEEPHGVVCDLSGADGAGQEAFELLDRVGRHVRDWPGAPVAIVSADADVRAALRQQPMSEHLILAASLPAAVTLMEHSPAPLAQARQLPPHPVAPRAARAFVARTLLDWKLTQAIGAGCLVASELVTNAIVHAGSDIDLSLSWYGRLLRVAVRDGSADLPEWQGPALDLHGRGLMIVAGCSRAWGVLPAADGGKVVWAVLDV